MTAIASLLAATDFSDGADRATRRAGLLAGAPGARLELLHVVSASALADLRALAPDGGAAAARIVDEANRLMAALAARLAASSARVEVGELPAAILDAAMAHDLLVLGSRGPGPIRELVLGTTAERSLVRARRPMLVVKREPEGAYRRVLVLCEYAPPARRALELALRWAPGSRITLVHVFEGEFESKLWRAELSQDQVAQLRAQATERTQAWLSGLREGLDGAADVEVLAPFGKPRAVVPALVESLGADLVVMGKQGRSRAAELFLGSVTRHILAEVGCDVLVAPSS